MGYQDLIPGKKTFVELKWIDEKYPYYRLYVTNIPQEASSSLKKKITLGILMDYNIGLEKYEGFHPSCWKVTGLFKYEFDHICSAFSNEDLPSAYLGYVSYYNGWGLQKTVEVLVDDINSQSKGTNSYPGSVAERYFDAVNGCFTPKTIDDISGRYRNLAWPDEIVYEFIGPGVY